jgi:alkylhydroperoxidase family enzyme
VPRLEPIEEADVRPELRVFYEADRERYGTVLNNTKLYAHNPAVLRAVKGFVAAFAEATTIPTALKALVRVRVAGINGCPF